MYKTLRNHRKKSVTLFVNNLNVLGVYMPQCCRICILFTPATASSLFLFAEFASSTQSGFCDVDSEYDMHAYVDFTSTKQLHYWSF